MHNPSDHRHDDTYHDRAAATGHCAGQSIPIQTTQHENSDATRTLHPWLHSAWRGRRENEAKVGGMEVEEWGCVCVYVGGGGGR